MGWVRTPEGLLATNVTLSIFTTLLLTCIEPALGHLVQSLCSKVVSRIVAADFDMMAMALPKEILL